MPGLSVRDPVPCLPSGRAVGSCPVPSEGLPAVPLPPFFGFWCVYGMPIVRTDIIKAVPAAHICTGATAPDPVGLSLYGSRIASAVAACLFRRVCIDVMRGLVRSTPKASAIASLPFSFSCLYFSIISRSSRVNSIVCILPPLSVLSSEALTAPFSPFWYSITDL